MLQDSSGPPLLVKLSPASIPTASDQFLGGFDRRLSPPIRLGVMGGRYTMLYPPATEEFLKFTRCELGTPIRHHRLRNTNLTENLPEYGHQFLGRGATPQRLNKAPSRESVNGYQVLTPGVLGKI